MEQPFFKSLHDALLMEHPFILAMVVERTGTGTRDHARMAVFSDGSTLGTIGGGAFEADVTAHARELFGKAPTSPSTAIIHTTTVCFAPIDEEYLLPVFAKAARMEKTHAPFVLGFAKTGPAVALFAPGVFRYEAPNGTVDEHAMREACERAWETGTADQETVVCDVIGRKEHLVFLGAGNVTRATARLAGRLGWSYAVVDPREEFVTRKLYPDAAALASPKDYVAGADTAPVDADAFVVITSHAALVDDVLALLQKRHPRYIGALGSRTWRGKWTAPNFHCPVGLDLGGESPEEMAISIMAQVLKTASHASGMDADRSTPLVVVRSAGDLATGSIIRLHRAGYAVLALEIPEPTVIRRTVSFAEAMYDGRQTVDGITAVRIDRIDQVWRTIDRGLVPVLPDPEGKAIKALHPQVVVDAIIAKKNLGTRIDDAPLVIALGPGFTAGKDCHAVIETQRGHTLGRVITQGSAKPNTGIPGIIAGYGKERVIHSSNAGTLEHVGVEIGSLVKAGDTVCTVGGVPQKTLIDGMVRGLLRGGMDVPAGFKIADVDPRGKDAIFTLPSDKTMAIAGGVLEAVDQFFHGQA